MSGSTHAFHITVSDRLDGNYPDSEPSSSTQKLHNEEMKYVPTYIGCQRSGFYSSSPNRPHLFSPVARQIDLKDVNVADFVVIGKRWRMNS